MKKCNTKKKRDGDNRTTLVNREQEQEQAQEEEEEEEEDVLFPNREQYGESGREQQQRSTLSSRSLVGRGIQSFREYSHHIIFLASLAYAIIYINMMRFVQPKNKTKTSAVAYCIFVNSPPQI